MQRSPRLDQNSVPDLDDEVFRAALLDRATDPHADQLVDGVPGRGHDQPSLDQFVMKILGKAHDVVDGQVASPEQVVEQTQIGHAWCGSHRLPLRGSVLGHEPPWAWRYWSRSAVSAGTSTVIG